VSIKKAIVRVDKSEGRDQISIYCLNCSMNIKLDPETFTTENCEVGKRIQCPNNCVPIELMDQRYKHISVGFTSGGMLDEATEIKLPARATGMSHYPKDGWLPDRSCDD